MNGTNRVVNSRVRTGNCGGRTTKMVLCCVIACFVVYLGTAGMGARANGQAVVVQTHPNGSGAKAQSPTAVMPSPTSVTVPPPTAEIEMAPMPSTSLRTEDPTVGAIGTVAEATIDHNSVNGKSSEDVKAANAAAQDKSNGKPASGPESSVRSKGNRNNKEGKKRDLGKVRKSRVLGDESTTRASSQRRQQDVKSARGKAKTGAAKSKRSEATGKNKAAKNKTMKIKSTKVKLPSSERESAKNRTKY